MNRILACFALLIILLPAHGAILGFDPLSATVMQGDSVSLNLIASDLGATLLGDFDLNLSYDPASLTLMGVTPSGVLGDVGAGEVLDFSLGSIGVGISNIALVSVLSAASLQPLQSTTPLLLVTLQFDIVNLAPGSSTTVSIAAVNALGDSAGNAIGVTSLDSAQFTGAGGDVVPEPGSMIAGVGLLLFAVRGLLART